MSDVKTFAETGIHSIEDLTEEITGFREWNRLRGDESDDVVYMTALTGKMICTYKLAIENGKDHEAALNAALDAAK